MSNLKINQEFIIYIVNIISEINETKKDDLKRGQGEGDSDFFDRMIDIIKETKEFGNIKEKFGDKLAFILFFCLKNIVEDRELTRMKDSVLLGKISKKLSINFDLENKSKKGGEQKIPNISKDDEQQQQYFFEFENKFIKYAEKVAIHAISREILELNIIDMDVVTLSNLVVKIVSSKYEISWIWGIGDKKSAHILVSIISYFSEKLFNKRFKNRNLKMFSGNFLHKLRYDLYNSEKQSKIDEKIRKLIQKLDTLRSKENARNSKKSETHNDGGDDEKDSKAKSDNGDDDDDDDHDNDIYNKKRKKFYDRFKNFFNGKSKGDEQTRGSNDFYDNIKLGAEEAENKKNEYNNNQQKKLEKEIQVKKLEKENIELKNEKEKTIESLKKLLNRVRGSINENLKSFGDDNNKRAQREKDGETMKTSLKYIKKLREQFYVSVDFLKDNLSKKIVDNQQIIKENKELSENNVKLKEELNNLYSNIANKKGTESNDLMNRIRKLEQIMQEKETEYGNKIANIELENLQAEERIQGLTKNLLEKTEDDEKEKKIIENSKKIMENLLSNNYKDSNDIKLKLKDLVDKLKFVEKINDNMSEEEDGNLSFPENFNPEDELVKKISKSFQRISVIINNINERQQSITNFQNDIKNIDRQIDENSVKIQNDRIWNEPLINDFILMNKFNLEGISTIKDVASDLILSISKIKEEADKKKQEHETEMMLTKMETDNLNIEKERLEKELEKIKSEKEKQYEENVNNMNLQFSKFNKEFQKLENDKNNNISLKNDEYEKQMLRNGIQIKLLEQKNIEIEKLYQQEKLEHKQQLETNEKINGINKKLEIEVGKLNKALESDKNLYNRTINKIQEEKETLESENEIISKKINELNKKNEELLIDNRHQKGEINDLKNKINEKEKEIANKQYKIDQDKKTIEDLNNQIQGYKDQLKNLLSSLDKEQRDKLRIKTAFQFYISAKKMHDEIRIAKKKYKNLNQDVQKKMGVLENMLKEQAEKSWVKDVKKIDESRNFFLEISNGINTLDLYAKKIDKWLSDLDGIKNENDIYKISYEDLGIWIKSSEEMIQKLEELEESFMEYITNVTKINDDYMEKNQKKIVNNNNNSNNIYGQINQEEDTRETSRISINFKRGIPIKGGEYNIGFKRNPLKDNDDAFISMIFLGSNFLKMAIDYRGKGIKSEALDGDIMKYIKIFRQIFSKDITQDFFLSNKMMMNQYIPVNLDGFEELKFQDEINPLRMDRIDLHFSWLLHYNFSQYNNLLKIFGSNFKKDNESVGDDDDDDGKEKDGETLIFKKLEDIENTSQDSNQVKMGKLRNAIKGIAKKNSKYQDFKKTNSLYLGEFDDRNIKLREEIFIYAPLSKVDDIINKNNNNNNKEMNQILDTLDTIEKIKLNIIRDFNKTNVMKELIEYDSYQIGLFNNASLMLFGMVKRMEEIDVMVKNSSEIMNNQKLFDTVEKLSKIWGDIIHVDEQLMDPLKRIIIEKNTENSNENDFLLRGNVNNKLEILSNSIEFLDRFKKEIIVRGNANFGGVTKMEEYRNFYNFLNGSKFMGKIKEKSMNKEQFILFLFNFKEQRPYSELNYFDFVENTEKYVILCHEILSIIGAKKKYGYKNSGLFEVERLEKFVEESDFITSFRKLSIDMKNSIFLKGKMLWDGEISSRKDVKILQLSLENNLKDKLTEIKKIYDKCKVFISGDEINFFESIMSEYPKYISNKKNDKGDTISLSETEKKLISVLEKDFISVLEKYEKELVLFKFLETFQESFGIFDLFLTTKELKYLDTHVDNSIIEEFYSSDKGHVDNGNNNNNNNINNNDMQYGKGDITLNSYEDKMSENFKKMLKILISFREIKEWQEIYTSWNFKEKPKKETKKRKVYDNNNKEYSLLLNHYYSYNLSEKKHIGHFSDSFNSNIRMFFGATNDWLKKLINSMNGDFDNFIFKIISDNNIEKAINLYKYFIKIIFRCYIIFRFYQALLEQNDDFLGKQLMNGKNDEITLVIKIFTELKDIRNPEDIVRNKKSNFSFILEESLVGKYGGTNLSYNEDRKIITKIIEFFAKLILNFRSYNGDNKIDKRDDKWKFSIYLSSLITSIMNIKPPIYYNNPFAESKNKEYLIDLIKREYQGKTILLSIGEIYEKSLGKKNDVEGGNEKKRKTKVVENN